MTLQEAVEHLQARGYRTAVRGNEVCINPHTLIIWASGRIYVHYPYAKSERFIDISWVRNPFSPTEEEDFLLGDIALHYPRNEIVTTAM